MNAAAVPAKPPRLPGAYAGEVSPADAWAHLCEHGGALVDVRTQAEWQWVGQPELAGSKGRMVSVSWKLPQGVVNAQFEAELRAGGLSETTPVFFLCRGGGRSLDAAVAMTQAGFAQCYNVTHGFEGEANEKRQRGTVNGWKASGLPWGQP